MQEAINKPEKPLSRLFWFVISICLEPKVQDFFQLTNFH
jgi:hypothetical protein